MFIEITIFKMIFKAFTLRTIRFSARTSKLSHLTPVAPSVRGHRDNICFIVVIAVPSSVHFAETGFILWPLCSTPPESGVVIYFISSRRFLDTRRISLSLSFQPVYICETWPRRDDDFDCAEQFHHRTKFTSAVQKLNLFQ